MYVIKTDKGFYYTGKAGDGWLSVNKIDAFTYTKEGAERKAKMFNNSWGPMFVVELV